MTTCKCGHGWGEHDDQDWCRAKGCACTEPISTARPDVTRYAEHIKNGAGWKGPVKL